MKNNKRTIHVVGINSFKFEDLTYDVQALFNKTKNIAVPDTFIDNIKIWVSQEKIGEKNFFVSRSNLNFIEWLKLIDNDVVLLSRGDPLWYGIGRILLKNFSEDELSFYPANTCIQLAFSRLKKPWQEVKAISIHGRDSRELIKSLKGKEKSIAIITDPKNNSLDLIRANLKELNLENYYEFWLFEELNSKNERITLVKNDENLPKNISTLNVVILLKNETEFVKSKLPFFGICDTYFQTFNDRPNLITKREVRIQILADLELPDHGTLLDIGAGSGAIGLEALRLKPKLKLICLDKRLGSKTLIAENARKLGVNPSKIIEGDINQYLNFRLKGFLSISNRIIIGGCDKETKVLILKFLSKSLKTDDIFVIPLVTYENLDKVATVLKEYDFETTINLIQTYKGISIVEGTRFEPNNPVFIIKAKKK